MPLLAGIGFAYARSGAILSPDGSPPPTLRDVARSVATVVLVRTDVSTGQGS